jgi:hypothetical protein
MISVYVGYLHCAWKWPTCYKADRSHSFNTGWRLMRCCYMDSLRKGRCECGQYLILWIYGMPRLRMSLELWRHCYEYIQSLRTADSGWFSSLGEGWWLSGYYTMLRRISGFDAVVGSCWVIFVGCGEFVDLIVAYFEKRLCGETKPWNN